MKESFRCRCDPAAEYFNVCAMRRGQAPFGHPLVSWWGLSVCKANRNHTSSTTNAPLDPTRGCHRGKGHQDLTDKVIFPFPIPSLLSPRDGRSCVIENPLPDSPKTLESLDFDPWFLPPGSALPCPGEDFDMRQNSGCSWMSLGVPGCPWVSLGVPGCPWVSLGVSGCPWVSLGVPGCPWVSLGVPGCSWVSLGVSGCPWVSLGVPGCPWTS